MRFFIFLLSLVFMTNSLASIKRAEDHFIYHNFLEGRLSLEAYEEPIEFYVLVHQGDECDVGVFIDRDLDVVVSPDFVEWTFDEAYTEVLIDAERSLIFLCPV